MAEKLSSGLVLAIDGGQTATTVALATSEGTLLAFAHGGPIVDVRTQRNATAMRAVFRDAIPAVLAGVPSDDPQIDLAYLSLTGGADQAADALREFVPCREIVIESDVFAVLSAATSAGPGIGLIAGTGSIAGFVSDDGRRLIKGGWGFLLGDEGSGFWIGLAGLRAAIAFEEGRGPSTSLRATLLEQLRVRDLRSAAAQIYDELDRAAIAALAEPIIRSAGTDPVAAEIALAAGRHLAELVASVAATAHPTGLQEKRIAPGGGVLRPGNAVWSSMASQLSMTLPDFELLAPVYPPVVGSLFLGLRKLHGENADDSIRRFETDLLNKALPRGKSATERAAL